MAILTVQLATPPDQPQAAGVPATNLGQAPISADSVLIVSAFLRPPEAGVGFAS